MAHGIHSSDGLEFRLTGGVCEWRQTACPGMRVTWTSIQDTAPLHRGGIGGGQQIEPTQDPYFTPSPTSLMANLLPLRTLNSTQQDIYSHLRQVYPAVVIWWTGHFIRQQTRKLHPQLHHMYSRCVGVWRAAECSRRVSSNVFQYARIDERSMLTPSAAGSWLFPRFHRFGSLCRNAPFVVDHLWNMYRAATCSCSIKDTALLRNIN